ncbi:hypothetical protein IMZ48_39400 [Candidatus Bathyarchaeota archaeon]|nr:hypothetical protein [Candidatus Bathyarchaeota archaeon]
MPSTGTARDEAAGEEAVRKASGRNTRGWKTGLFHGVGAAMVGGFTG